MKFTTKTNNQGNTLFECLMAILIISTILSFIFPLFLIATATRLQNRRAEQAMALAQQEIDRIQTLMSQGVNVSEEALLPPALSNSNSISTVGAPNQIVEEDASVTDVLQARKIDINRDGSTDFLLQTFRDQGIRFNQGSAANELAILGMGVRVYSIRAADNLNDLEVEAASLILTSGFGQQIKRPLAAVETEIGRGDLDLSKTSYDNYLNLFN